VNHDKDVGIGKDFSRDANKNKYKNSEKTTEGGK